MFGSIDKGKGLLFVTYDLDQVLRATMRARRRPSESVTGQRRRSFADTRAASIAAKSSASLYGLVKYRKNPA